MTPETPEQTGTSLGEKTTVEAVSQVQFSKIGYVEPVTTDEVNSHQQRELVNPMPDQTPTAVLGRRRFLGQNTLLDPAFPAVTQWTFDAWAALKNIPKVQDYLNLFVGFRADLRLSFLCRAAPGTYGMYLISWCYGTPQSQTLTDVLSWDSFVCDISVSESTEFVIPYRWPYEYRRSTSSDQTSAIHIVVTNLMSKSVDSGSALLDLAVYGSFENIDSGMYIEDATVEAQMETGKGEPTLTTTDALGSMAFLGLGAMNTLFNRNTDSTYRPGDNNHVPEDTKAQSSSGKARGVRQSFFGDLATIDPEDGITSLDALHKPPGLVNMDHMSMEGNMSFDAIGRLPGFLSWQTVTSNTPIDDEIRYVIGLNTTAGAVGFSDLRSASWAAYYSRFFRYYRGEHQLMLHFACSPLVSARFSLHINYIYGSDYNGGFLDGYPSFEQPNEIFMIKGPQTKAIAIPWNQRMGFRSCRDIVAIVTLRLIQPPSTYSADVTSIGVLATHSVDHLQFASPQHPYRTRYTGPGITKNRPKKNAIVELQSSLRHEHSNIEGNRFGASKHVKMKSYMHIIPTLHDLMRRWDDNYINGFPEPITALDIEFPDTQVEFEESALLVTAVAPFGFMTGSVENRLYFTGNGRPEAVVQNNGLNTSLRVGDGMSTTLVPAWPVLEFKTPWLADAPVVCIPTDIPAQDKAHFTPVLVNYQGASIDLAIVRAGEDFQVFYPNRLPNYEIWGSPEIVPP